MNIIYPVGLSCMKTQLVARELYLQLRAPGWSNESFDNLGLSLFTRIRSKYYRNAMNVELSTTTHVNNMGDLVSHHVLQNSSYKIWLGSDKGVRNRYC